MCPCSGIQSARTSIFMPSLIVKCVEGTLEVRGLTLVMFSTPGENPIAAHSSLTQTSHMSTKSFQGMSKNCFVVLKTKSLSGHSHPCHIDLSQGFVPNIIRLCNLFLEVCYAFVLECPPKACIVKAWSLAWGTAGK